MKKKQYPTLTGVYEDSRVLTDKRGIVYIDEVRDSDLIWDGTEFVRHEGTIYLGDDVTIAYQGLSATFGAYVYTKRRKEPIPFQIISKQKIELIKGWDLELSDPLIPTYSEVVPIFSIINCGPRHRFAAEGFIVHNHTIL